MAAFKIEKGNAMANTTKNLDKLALRKMSFKDRLKNMNLIQNYRRIFPYMKPYLGRALLALVITIPIGSMDAVIAWVLKPYMDTVMIEKSVQTMSLVPALIIVFSLLQSILNYASTYLNKWVGNRITVDLKLDLFKKLIHNDPAFFDQNTSGEVQYRFNTDAEQACNGLLNNLKVFSTRIFSSIALICVLIWNSWQLSVVALLVLFLALYPLKNMRRKIKDIMAQTVFSGSKIVTHYNEAFSGNRVITSYNLYEYKTAQFKETLRTVFKLGMKMVKKTGLVTPFMHFMISIGIAGVVWYGSYLITHNQITAGGFVSFITALLMLYHPIKSMGTSFANVQVAFMAMDRVFNRLEDVPKIQNKKGAVKIEHIKKGIAYKDVWFEYVAGRPVLKGVNLTIPKGQTFAFVGNSGGGKTTLVNLLPRFYDVTQGSITIDGVDVRDIDLYDLRDHIAVVFQDNTLFAGTIRDNILLGKENATDAEVHQAIKNACLDEFVATLPNGLDTQIGERGILLSGGQRQRIAIARAFIKNAPIVILDEATSALDNKSEHIVQQAIYNLMEDRTVFIVAHRLSTVRNADKIVVVNNGEIAEIGSHDELINQPNSIYASLYQTQLK